MQKHDIADHTGRQLELPVNVDDVTLAAPFFRNGRLPHSVIFYRMTYRLLRTQLLIWCNFGGSTAAAGRVLPATPQEVMGQRDHQRNLRLRLGAQEHRKRRRR